MTAYANIDGHTCIEARLHIPNVGPWWADVTFEGVPDLSGAVVLSIGSLTLRGTIVETQDGVFGQQRRSRVVAGGGGWGTLLGALHYHNDAGVRALSVAQDAARLAGETLGEFAPELASIGVDYVREAGLASRVLEDVIGAVPWWVDYDGVTQVGERPTSETDAGDYELLGFDPRQQLATLAVDDLSRVGIGSILSARLDAPLTVRELAVNVDADVSRVTAWGGGTATGRGRLAGLFRGLVRRSVDEKLFAKYKFRVLRMSGARVELQAVSRAANLPDTIPVSQRPGTAGAHAKLAAGSLVLVEFIEGDRTMPIVSAFAGKDDGGHEADELDFSVSTTLRLGGPGASEGVGLGDSLKSYLDGHAHVYTPPSTGTPLLTSPPSSAPVFALDPAPAGSGKVKVDS